ncbi:MAG: hypothetical protein F4X66_20465 [Chloroflexi bacterium]|nr:hypothetical protein [Chloroflexota bacterium]MYE40801.1 hypothetical protein [Chloroflexota bacterium]
MTSYILDFDYLTQLVAIRGLLGRNQQADATLSKEISDSAEWARQTTGRANDFAVDQMVDLLHISIYQAVAHSMAAVGMLAPFMEGVFKDAFKRIGEELPRRDTAKNILAIAERRGLTPCYLPDDLATTIEALFRYRNDSLHWGFEWPKYVCQQFQDATAQWPDGWFEVARIDAEPWMFSMSATFIDHCFEVAKETVGGLQDFLVDVARRENGLKPLGRQKERMSWLWDG